MDQGRPKSMKINRRINSAKWEKGRPSISKGVMINRNGQKAVNNQ